MIPGLASGWAGFLWSQSSLSLLWVSVGEVVVPPNPPPLSLACLTINGQVERKIKEVHVSLPSLE